MSKKKQKNTSQAATPKFIRPILIGLGVGLGIGAVIGLATDNLATALALCGGIGVAVGLVSGGGK